MQTMKKLITISLLALILLSACAAEESTESSQESEKINVIASFYPLEEFTRQVGKDLIEVRSITPAGADPHEYEPTPKDIASVTSADMFLFNGAGQDPWAEKIAPEVSGQVVEMTPYFSLLEHDEEAPEDEHDEEAPEDDHEEDDREAEAEHHDEDVHEHHHELDPHIWLDPTIAAQEVEIIAQKLTKLDPENSEAYQQNAAAYQSQLTALDKKFQDGLANCKQQNFVTSHTAFGYLAKRYNLHQIPIRGISTEEEPSARKLGEIADLAEEKGIKYIFFETLVSPRLSQTLADEIGAQTLVLNPIGGLTKEEVTSGKNYVTVMEDNLENLRTALECE